MSALQATLIQLLQIAWQMHHLKNMDMQIVEQPNAAIPEENTTRAQLDSSPAIPSDLPMHLTTPTTARGPSRPAT